MRSRSVLTAALAGIGLVLSSSAAVGAAATDTTVPADVTSEVTIKRDEYGIPHVYAETTWDLYYGYGYVVGEDRLFQMEMAKRSVIGTAAEVVGPEALANDRISRSNYDPQAIAAQIEALPQEDLDILAGYAAGLNAKIDEVLGDRENLLPRQFTDHGFEPEHWTAYDVAMIWVGTMASRFSDSAPELRNLQLRNELVAELGETEGGLLFDQLVWVEDPTAVTTVPREDLEYQDVPGEMPYDGVAAAEPPAAGAAGEAEGSAVVEDSASAVVEQSANHADHLASLADVALDLDDAESARMEHYGGGEWPHIVPEASNVWLVGSDKTHDGESIFLNGPQFGNFNPSYVFGIGLHGAGYDVVGNAPFAYPAVLFGTNNDIVWGSTAGPLDVNDVYQVELHPEDSTRYRFDGEWREMDVREEVIAVKGEQDAVQRTHYTVHGAVSSIDEENGVAYAKRRSWDGIEIDTLIAWVKSTKATNWEEFLDSASVMGITNNWYYADKDGNIGYVSVGRLPQRPQGQDQRLPAIGDGSMEWEGFRPFSENPQVFNPRQGYIANWNNQSAAGFSALNTWGPVHRVNEITARLQSQERFTTQEIWAINEETSFAELNVRYLRPYLLDAAARVEDDALRADVSILTDWDGQVRDEDRDGFYDGPQPAIMAAWLPLLTQAVLADHLPESVYRTYASFDARNNPVPALQLIDNAFRGEEAGVPQHVDFLDGRDPLDIVLETYLEALDSIREAHGPAVEDWEREPVVTHDFSHRNFMGVLQANEEEALRAPVAMNRGTQNHLVTLAPDAAEMCVVAPPGQSGFIAPDGTRAPHYSDQFELYVDFGCAQSHLTAAAVDASTVSTTVLVPQPTPTPTDPDPTATESPTTPAPGPEAGGQGDGTADGHPPGGELPATGASVAVLALLGGLLIAAGGALWARRNAAVRA